jgi:hypothetical protein
VRTLKTFYKTLKRNSQKSFFCLFIKAAGTERMETSISLERFIKIREILKVPYSEFFDCADKNTYKQDLKDHSNRTPYTT